MSLFPSPFGVNAFGKLALSPFVISAALSVKTATTLSAIEKLIAMESKLNGRIFNGDCFNSQ